MEGRSKLQLVIELIGSLMMLWMMVPEHKQQELLMGATKSCQRLTERLARRLGRTGMLDELDGREKTARFSYDAAYGLMTGPKVRLEKMYDKLRGAIT